MAHYDGDFPEKCGQLCLTFCFNYCALILGTKYICVQTLLSLSKAEVCAAGPIIEVKRVARYFTGEVV